MGSYKIILLRHGESVWNKENRFTGWTDVGLTEKGIEEAKNAGKLIKEAGVSFDVAYTSVLNRAIKSLWLVLEGMDLMWIPVFKSWRLNERHYGALQGFNKADMAKKEGDQQVHIWRRSYDVRPPAMDKTDERYAGSDMRYKDLSDEEIPLTECLKDTVERFLPYWSNVIAPSILEGKSVIIAAHGNSLRALVKHLDGVSDEEIPNLNIPTGIPLVYELDDNLKPIKHYYLGDKDTAKKAALAVSRQASGQK